MAFPPQPPFAHVARPASAAAVSSALNLQYSSGTTPLPGLLVHQFDDTEDHTRPWRGCPGGVSRAGAGSECARFGSRLSCLVLNQKIVAEGGGLFSATKSGIIYDARAVLMRCAYGGDGGTRGSPDGCRKFDWCAEGRLSAGDVWCSGKPHRASDLPLLLSFHVPPSGYHEVIVDAASIERRLPDAVLAFFFPANGAGRTYATAARDRFLAEYPAVAPASLPLLRYNPAAKQTPFEPAGGT